MVNVMESVLTAFIAMLGVVTALDCFTCDWNSKNGTVDDNCLIAPYKTQVQECPTSDNVGMRYMCQTFAQFDVSGDDMHITSLQRKCGLKHSKCNNLCSDKSTDCWICCQDNDKCNGFPLRTNVMTVSGASAGHRTFMDTVVLFTSMWIVYIY